MTLFHVTRRLRAAALGAAACLFGAVPAMAAGVANVYVWSARGAVEAGVGGKDWREVGTGVWIGPGGFVRTQADSNAMVQSGNRSLCKLDVESELRYDDFSEKDKAQRLDMGLSRGRLFCMQALNTEGAVQVGVAGGGVRLQRGAIAVRWDPERAKGFVSLKDGEACLLEGKKSDCRKGSGRWPLPSGAAFGDSFAASGPEDDKLWKDEGFLLEYFSRQGENLDLIKPVHGEVMALPEVTAAGRVKPGVRVRLNGAPVSVSDAGTFKEKLKIHEGVNCLAVSAEEFPGRRYVTVRCVELDARDPLLEIIAPRDNFPPDLEGKCFSNECFVDIIGYTEPGIDLYVNRQKISHLVDPSDGHFQIPDFRLDLRDRVIEFEAVDHAQRRVSRQIRIGDLFDADRDGIPDSSAF